MASFFGGLGGAFLRGAADQATSEINSYEDEDNKKRNMVLQTSLDEHKQRAEAQNEVYVNSQRDKDATVDKQTAIAAKLKQLNFDTDAATNTSNNDASTQAQQPQAPAPQQQPVPMAPQGQPNAQGAAPISPAGSIQSSNLPAPQGAIASPPVQQGQDQGQQQQPMAPPPPPPTASTQAPLQHTPNPAPSNVQDTSSNNSSTDNSVNVQSAPVSVTDKLLAANKIILSPDDKDKLQNAPSSINAMNLKDATTYVQLDSMDKKQAAQFLANNKMAKAWNITHGNLGDGTPVGANDLPLEGDNDPLGLVNPSQNILGLASNESRMNTLLNGRTKELSYDKNSPYTLNVLQPKEQALSNLERLNSQQTVTELDKTASGTGGNQQAWFENLARTMGVDDFKGISSGNQLTEALSAQEKREGIRVPGQRVTNQEATQFFKAIPGLENTPEGRLAIINFMKAQSAKQLEGTKILDAYKDVNHTLQGSDSIVDKYFAENKIVNTSAIDPANPSSIINMNAKSFENWQGERLGKLMPGPNGTSIDPASGQPVPDTLKMALASPLAQPQQGQAQAGGKVTQSQGQSKLSAKTQSLLDSAIGQ